MSRTPTILTICVNVCEREGVCLYVCVRESVCVSV